MFSDTVQPSNLLKAPTSSSAMWSPDRVRTSWVHVSVSVVVVVPVVLLVVQISAPFKVAVFPLAVSDSTHESGIMTSFASSVSNSRSPDAFN